jgi:hypothetical protein
METITESILDSIKKPDVLEEPQFTQHLHGSTSQKTAFFMVTDVITSNPSGIQ